MLALTYFHETWQMIWPFICNLGFIKQVFIKYLFIILFDELVPLFNFISYFKKLCTCIF